MNVLMMETVAHPDYILKKGRVYDLPRGIAQKQLKSTLVGNVTVDAKNDVHMVSGGPAAVEYNERRHGKKPILRVPSRPDPEDRPDIGDEEEFEEIEDS